IEAHSPLSPVPEAPARFPPRSRGGSIEALSVRPCIRARALSFPPRSRGGSIEADGTELCGYVVDAFPPRSRDGSIEASYLLRYVFDEPRFRRVHAAAPLKRLLGRGGPRSADASFRRVHAAAQLKQSTVYDSDVRKVVVSAAFTRRLH